MNSKKLSILSLQYFCYPDAVGGAWKYTYEVNKRLVERGHQVALIACKPTEDSPDYECLDGIHYYRIDTESSKSVWKLWRSIYKTLKTIRKRSRIDLVHVHNPLIHFLALLNPVLWGIPKIYHFHSLWYDEERINRGLDRAGTVWNQCAIDGTLSQGIRGIEWLCFASSKVILFLSEYSKRKFLSFYPFRKPSLKVIPGGVDTSWFVPPLQKSDSLKKDLGLPVDRPILFTVRRLVERMGLDNLILAADELVKRNPDCKFQILIVGKGPMEEKLRNLIHELGLNERIKLLGALTTKELPDYYRAADAFVLPTRSIEGFGLATVEALSCGLPVFGTPVGGTVEILQAVDERLLFTDITPSAIADGIETFLNHPKPFTDLSPACRKLAVERYDWERVVDRIEVELHTAVKPN